MMLSIDGLNLGYTGLMIVDPRVDLALAAKERAVASENAAEREREGFFSVSEQHRPIVL